MLYVVVLEHIGWEQCLEVSGQLAVLSLCLLIDTEEATKVIVVVHRFVILFAHFIQFCVPDLEQICRVERAQTQESCLKE